MGWMGWGWQGRKVVYAAGSEENRLCTVFPCEENLASATYQNVLDFFFLQDPVLLAGSRRPDSVRRDRARLRQSARRQEDLPRPRLRHRVLAQKYVSRCFGFLKERGALNLVGNIPRTRDTKPKMLHKIRCVQQTIVFCPLRPCRFSLLNCDLVCSF